MFTSRTATRTPSQEAAEDIYFGQVVNLWARWFFIAASTILSLWSAKTTLEITLSVILVVVFMGINFFLHGRYLVGKPANRFLLMLASAFDVAIVTLIVFSWQTHTGLNNPYFILYYPLLFAFALIFSPTATAGYTLATLGLYVTACLLADASFVSHIEGWQILLQRMITLAATGALGTFYWRIQRDRRRALKAQLA